MIDFYMNSTFEYFGSVIFQGTAPSPGLPDTAKLLHIWVR